MGNGAFYVICPRASSQYVTPLWVVRAPTDIDDKLRGLRIT